MFRPLTVIALAILAIRPAAAADTDPADMIEKRVPIRTHSLAAPYVDSDLQNRWWDFGGDAIINTNKHVRLTQDRQSESGFLWSRMPLSLTNWQMDVEFKVDGKSSGLYGDGFAIWITKDRAVQGPVFGAQDYFTGLGIFFDTYANSRHSYSFPRITAMMGDGHTQYDHAGDNTAHEVAACSDNFRRQNVATKVRITYVQGHGLELQVHTKEWEQWTKCFVIPDAQLPATPFIGFTAATGDVSDAHDIVSVNTFSATLSPQFRDVGKGAQAPLGAPAPSSKGSWRTKSDNSGRKPDTSRGASGWFLLILKVIGVVAFIVFALAAYKTYSAQQRTRPHYY